MAKDKDNDSVELLAKLQKTEVCNGPLVATGSMSMRDLVIQTALHVGITKAMKVYMPDGRIGDRRQFFERAASEVINMADMMANAYDLHMAQKNS